MKISKLFHWLYAFLMVLPLAFLAPNVFYYAFNKDAENSNIQTATVNYKYETNEVNSESDLKPGNLYFVRDFGYGYFEDDVDNVIYSDFFLLDIDGAFYSLSTGSCLSYDAGDGILTGFGSSTPDIEFGSLVFLNSYRNGVLAYHFIMDNWYSGTDPEIIFSACPTEYIPIESVTIETDEGSIVNSINQNIKDTFDLPMFSWTKDNFIVKPFNKLGSMMGMPSDSVVYYYLDYWLCVSIIYLVFDVVMYVPLLAHRWIDKAVIE